MRDYRREDTGHFRELRASPVQCNADTNDLLQAGAIETLAPIIGLTRSLMDMHPQMIEELGRFAFICVFLLFCSPDGKRG